MCLDTVIIFGFIGRFFRRQAHLKRIDLFSTAQFRIAIPWIYVHHVSILRRARRNDAHLDSHACKLFCQQFYLRQCLKAVKLSNRLTGDNHVDQLWHVSTQQLIYVQLDACITVVHLDPFNFPLLP